MSPGVLLIIFAFGLAVGSFLNVVIYRLPSEISIVTPSSHCPSCGSPIRFYDNIPLVSYLALWGKCRDCGVKISPRYFMVELTTGFIALALYLKFGLTTRGLAYLIFSGLLIAVTFIDLDTMTIPDSLSIPGIPAGILASSFITGVGFTSSVLGTIVGGGVLLALSEAYWLLRKREGMGGGDIKLLAMIGAFIGLKGILITLVLGSAVGAVVGLFVVGFSKGEEPAKIPFGPFLSIGALSHLFWGNELINWYIGILAR